MPTNPNSVPATPAPKKKTTRKKKSDTPSLPKSAKGLAPKKYTDSVKNLIEKKILVPGESWFWVKSGMGCLAVMGEFFLLDKNSSGSSAMWQNEKLEISGSCSCSNLRQEMEIYILEKKVKKGATMFDRIIIEPEKLEAIESALSQVENTDKIFKAWGFGDVFEKGTAVSLLFYGEPGTGKTLMGQAIAEKLGRELVIIQSAEIQSSEPGQAERNIKARFMGAQKQNQVLLFDECDSLIADREEVGMILGAQINALLSALEMFTGVVIFTTNRIGRLDPAFERRISAKVEFSMPDYEARVKIWHKLLPKKAPIVDRESVVSELAKAEIAGGHIKNMIMSAVRHAVYKKLNEITPDCFMVAMKNELQGKKKFEEAIHAVHKHPRMVGYSPSAKISQTLSPNTATS